MNHEDSTREELFADPAEVVTFAQAYFATEYPNGERRGCPSAEALRATARYGSLPNTHLRAHLFKCSECFRSYRSARMGHRPQGVARDSRWLGLSAARSSLTSRRTAFTVGSLCLIVFGFTAVLIWHTHKETTSVAVNNSRQETAVSPMSSVPPTTAPAAAEDSKPLSEPSGVSMTHLTQTAQLRRPKAATRISRTSPALPIIEINLKEDGFLRHGDEAGGRQRVINLSQERQRLRLQMPHGSGSGRYTVTVVDAFGKPLITTIASSNGKTLTVALDLRSLDTKKYRLCLARSGEAPDCYLISINERTRRAVK